MDDDKESSESSCIHLVKRAGKPVYTWLDILVGDMNFGYDEIGREEYHEDHNQTACEDSFAAAYPDHQRPDTTGKGRVECIGLCYLAGNLFVCDLLCLLRDTVRSSWLFDCYIGFSRRLFSYVGRTSYDRGCGANKRILDRISSSLVNI